jgi:uncharacterized Zn finger protein
METELKAICPQCRQGTTSTNLQCENCGYVRETLILPSGQR